jgi:hypothetical protein
MNQKLATVPLPPRPKIWTCVRSGNNGEAFQSSTAESISTFAPNHFHLKKKKVYEHMYFEKGLSFALRGH